MPCPGCLRGIDIKAAPCPGHIDPGRRPRQHHVGYCPALPGPARVQRHNAAHRPWGGHCHQCISDPTACRRQELFHFSRWWQINGKRHTALTAAGRMPVAVQPATERLNACDLLHNSKVSEDDHGANAFAAVHQVKCAVDILERHGVGNHPVQLDFAAHVAVHVAG